MTEFLDGMSERFGSLYEHRDPCNAAAVLQLSVILLSFVVTYPVWWCGLFGSIVSLIGYYGSKVPVMQSKVSFVHFYYMGCCFLLILEVISSFILIVFVSKWAFLDLWAYIVIIFGSLALVGQIYVTYMAMNKAHAYRAELMRNPPPIESIYAETESKRNTMYKAMNCA